MENMENAIGYLGDKYLLLEEIASEPLSVGVYKVIRNETINENNNISVAKVFYPKKKEDYDREISTLKTITNAPEPSEYLVKLIDRDSYGEGKIKIENKREKDVNYAVIEYEENGDLLNYFINTDEKIPEDLCKLLFHYILKGIQSLHHLGIAHRDIKPDNIFVGRNFNIKIADYGWAEKNIPNFNDYAGTPGYCCLEIIKKIEGKNIVYNGFKADIFSLGITLLTFLTGKSVFYDFGIEGIKFWLYDMIAEGKFLDFWKIIDEFRKISDETKQFIERMLCPEPENRPSIDVLIEDEWFGNLNLALDNILKENLKQRMINTISENSSFFEDVIVVEPQTDLNNIDLKGVSEKKEYIFNIKPIHVKKFGEDRNRHYIKITGQNTMLEESYFMNKLIDKINQTFTNYNCFIEESKESFGFIIIFFKNKEDIIERGEENENKDYDEELENALEKFKEKNRLKIYVQLIKLENEDGYDTIITFDKITGNKIDFNEVFKLIIEKGIKEIIKK